VAVLTESPSLFFSRMTMWGPGSFAEVAVVVRHLGEQLHLLGRGQRDVIGATVANPEHHKPQRRHESKAPSDQDLDR
jgi:hypothetical protein